jgi:membrane-associated phospholipid phosphatase
MELIYRLRKNRLIIFGLKLINKMQPIVQWDRALLKHINAEWHNSFLDNLLPAVRNQDTWLPLYLFLILFVAFNYKKTRWWWIVFAISSVVITNFISSSLLKENIIRLRPCNDPAVANWIRLFKGIYLPQSSSFTSSHAANHFGMAMFFYTTFKKQFKTWPLLFFIWAFVISYAQMYIGVHYPTDILAGTIIGLIIGYFTGQRFNKQYGLS